ncbi:pyridoxal phosphate-dependent aminotransferase [Pelagibacterium lacus]|uniref:Pyridoxal phosphate-dependent aminotransferase n=1 Tax=Pelagibacterium lacus TaxID=2282655 RepID=A0A369W412_9HYPH|nr:pyridoxal phosphate-dependent aminotransferase [Pelagibacterium lacus]RDE08070.1 pyridoxal phosphate-dependent aminotransferase [Pelagibacterium lacus]
MSEGPVAPRPAGVIAALPATVPFVGPEVIERRTGRPFRARLGANENAFGPSPRVVAAIAAHAGDVWTYGDSEAFELRAALAAHLDLPRDAITVGEGIDGLLGLVCRLYLEPGDRVVTSLGAYPTFNYHVAAQGAELVTVPYRDDREDLDALAEAARAMPTAIVYLANPDNPMGTWWPRAAVEDFIARVPGQTLIVLDEAYGETAPKGTLPPSTLLRPNLLRFRTFSKAYGLAGMRVAYGFGEPGAIALFDRIRNHFGVNALAQIAARAALADADHMRAVVDKIGDNRRALAELVAELGLAAIPSATNFLAIDCGGAARADAMLKALLDKGIFVRKPTVPVLDRCIRISIGRPEQMALAHAALRAAAAETGAL